MHGPNLIVCAGSFDIASPPPARCDASVREVVSSPLHIASEYHSASFFLSAIYILSFRLSILFFTLSSRDTLFWPLAITFFHIEH